MSLAIIDLIRRKIRNREYEFAISHFFEEMADDDMVVGSLLFVGSRRQGNSFLLQPTLSNERAER